MQRRKKDFEHLHYSGRLTHEYLINLFFHQEQSQLDFYKHNQDLLKVTQCKTYLDFLNRTRKDKKSLKGRILLKVGGLVMLIVNLNPSQCLMNRTKFKTSQSKFKAS